MAILTDQQRQDLWADLMRDFSARAEPCGVTKADLRAAIDAADDWADANAGSYNTALPLPTRTALNARAKAFILTYVIDRRFRVL